MRWIGLEEPPPESAMALVEELKLLVPLAGLIDKEAELRRLGKEIARLDRERQQAEAKLSNPNFTERAPQAVIAKERQKLEEALTALAHLKAQQAKLQALSSRE